MSINHISGPDFESQVIKSKKPTLVDFYAEWCGPCKRVATVLEEISKKNTNICIVKINVDSEQDLASRYNISSIPTLILFKGGEPVGQIVGAVAKSDIEKLVT